MKPIHTEQCPVCGSGKLDKFLDCKDNFATSEVFTIVKCADCGFALTQDFPAENEIGRYYDVPEYVSHSDTQKGVTNRLYHIARKKALKYKSEIVKKYTKLEKGLLLDIGCGTGYFLNCMKEQKWVVTGVEKSDSAKAYAKSKFDLDIQDPDYLYDIHPETKDVITMWHVLEHIQQLNRCMTQLHSILKEDGVAIIALPNKKSYDATSYTKNWAAYDVPRHLWHFSPSDFNHLAEKHNFELIDSKPMHFDAFYISMLSEQNKGTTAGSFIGLMKGGIFFLQSLFNKQGCSSLIYILKKKNHKI